MSGLRWTAEQLSDFEKRTRSSLPASVVGTTDNRVDMVRLVLPYPPSINSAGANNTRSGRKSGAYNAFLIAVRKAVTEAGKPRLEPESRLAVSIDAVPPDKRRRDIDNLLKVTIDALQQAGVYEDDALIDDLRIRRMPCLIPGNGSLSVTVRAI